MLLPRAFLVDLFMEIKNRVTMPQWRGNGGIT